MKSEKHEEEGVYVKRGTHPEPAGTSRKNPEPPGTHPERNRNLPEPLPEPWQKTEIIKIKLK